MQHGGWMAEPRRGADHLNEDAPAGPHADVRTSQPVATSGSDQVLGVGVGLERELSESGRLEANTGPSKNTRHDARFSDGTAARLAEQPLQEQPTGAAVARMITADDITSPEQVSAGSPALGRAGRLGRDDRAPSRSILAS